MAENPSSETPRPGSVILIVDDDEGLQHLIGGSLRREGHTIATAGSGREALQWLGTHSADLLLVDLKLADIQGPELVARLLEVGRAIPFITITGQGDERVAVEMMKQGALDYLVKDVRFLEMLPTVVRRALDQLGRDTKLAAAEAALEREHTFTAAILETVGALVVVLDVSGRIVRFNRECEQVTGFRAEEVMGHVFWERLVPAEEVPAVRRVFDHLVALRIPSQHENPWLTRDGAQRLISWSNTVLLATDGSVQYVIGTGIDLTERKALEKEILEISDREQRRIGHDLHDSLGQQLTALELLSQALVGKLKTAAPALVEPSREICRQIQYTIRTTRLLSHGLSPVPLGDDGLMTALGELAAGSDSLGETRCEFQCVGNILVPDATVASHLYRIAQEAVNNSLKHGRATQIRITLRDDPDQYIVAVDDNGRGLGIPLSPQAGMGLRIMRYRARLIGAELDLESGPSKGVRITCKLPKRK
ncbi:MAG TPA: hypothetical protein DCM86_16750 [Verrucomicrobiales bacterium]|nr:hypothetical protein [Verrucomicrobiales bacterium]